jgi:hypothetical protein
MGNKKARNVDAQPLAVPLYIPTEGGAGELVLGSGEVRGSTLIITFNTLLPSEAIKHRIERGEIVGITFVIPEDEAEAYREDEERRAKDAADLSLLQEDSGPDARDEADADIIAELNKSFDEAPKDE